MKAVALRRLTVKQLSYENEDTILKHKLSARRLYFGTVAFALLTAIVHTAIYLNFYDFGANLWQRDVSPFFELVSYLLLIPAAALGVQFALTLAHAEGDGTESPFADGKVVKGAALAVFLMLVMTLVAQAITVGSYDRLNLLLDQKTGNVFGVYMSLTASLHIFTLILALPAALYFLSRLVKTKYQIALGLFAIGYFVMLTLRVYFDMTMHINNPRWAFRVVALISVILYLVAEIRALISPEKKRALTVVGFVTLTLTLTESLSAIVMAIGFYTSEGWELTYSVLLLAVAVYIALRLFAMTLSKPAVAVDEGTVSEEGVTAADPADTGVTAVTALSEEEASEEADGIAPDDEELTQDELKRFYAAIYRTVAEKRGIGEDASDEEKAQLRKETMALLAHLFDGDSRRENIRLMREFLSRVEGNEE